MRNKEQLTPATRAGALPGLLAAVFMSLFLLSPAPVQAQDETGGIRGQVLDERTGTPIPAAQVLILGTTRGAITGRDGRFQVGELRPGTYDIEIRSIGFRSARTTVRVAPETFTDVDLALRLTAVPLDEVVATGQAGAVARRGIATSVATVEARELENAPINTFSEFLQARAPGVQVLPSGGMPGQGSRVVLRGFGSLQRNVQPVIYVDGIRVDNSGDTFMDQTSFGGHAWMGLDDIAAEDIERVEIVRGASAANLYGSEAAAGVIQIFTKQGQEGIQNFYLRSEAGYSDTPREWWDLDGRSDHVDAFFDRYVNSGFQHRQHMSVRGAVDRFSYYASGTFRDVEGVLPNTGMRHASFRANMNVSPFQEFTFGLSTGFSRRTVDFPYDGASPIGFGLNALGGEDGVNVHPDTALILDVGLAASRYTAGARMDWTPFRNWHHQLVLGLDFFTSDNTDFHPFGSPTAPDRQGSKSNARRIANTYNADYRTTYMAELGDRWASRTSFGVQGYSRDINWNWAYGEGWPAPGLETVDVAANQTGNENRYYTEQMGFYLEEQLSLDDFLYLTLAGRYDGHSAAGRDARWQFYPKLGLSYLPSEHGVIPESLGTVRLRAAYGEAGQAPEDYSSLRSLRGIAVVANVASGIIPGNIGDRNLAPERSREIELGMDVGLLDDRVSVEATYYNQRTDNAIFPVYSIPSEGFVEPQARNVGGLTGQGFELAARASMVRTGSLEWTAWTSLGFHENEVQPFTDITAVPENIYGTQWIRPGYPVGAFFDEDESLIGPAYPTRSLTFGSSARINGGLSIRALLDHQGGHHVESNTLRALDQANTPAGETFDTPRSAYVFEADLWRLREVVVGYELPGRVYSMLPVQSVELSVAGRNLWRSQSYPGIEAEASFDPLMQRANQTYFGAPLSRQLVIGLSARFGALD
jgi:TonB-dependent starch-binding outer membrane protein SusC